MTNPDPTSSAAKARKITPQDPPQYPCLLSNNGVVYDGPFFAMPTTSLGRDKYTGWWIPRDLSSIPDAPYVKIEAGVEVKTPTWCYDYMWQWVPVPGHVLSQYTHTCANPADRKPSGRPDVIAEADAQQYWEDNRPVPTSLPCNGTYIAPNEDLIKPGDVSTHKVSFIKTDGRSACPPAGVERKAVMEAHNEIARILIPVCSAEVVDAVAQILKRVALAPASGEVAEAGPTDGEMLDWLCDNPIHEIGFGIAPRTIMFNGECFGSLRHAIRSAMSQAGKGEAK